MLKLTLNTEEYLMVGENVKIVFLGGTKNNLRILVDAPKDVPIVRSTAMAKRYPQEAEKMERYYAEPELPEQYRKKKGTGRIRPKMQEE